MSFIKTTSLSALVAAVLAVACSTTSDRPPAGGGSPVPGGGSSGTTTDGSSGSSGSSGADGGDGGPGATCDGPKQQGAVVAELGVAGDAPPALGGTITPGTYVLVEATSYGPAPTQDAGGDAGATGGLTGVSARSTVDVTGTTLRFFGSRGPSASLPADAVTGLVYTLVGTDLQTTTVCPTAGAKKNIAFSAVGGGLAIFIDATHREVYAAK